MVLRVSQGKGIERSAVVGKNARIGVGRALCGSKRIGHIDITRFAVGKISQWNKGVITAFRTLEHQAILSKVRYTFGQNAIEHGSGKVAILVELELCNLPCLACCPRTRIERQDEHFAGARHGNVEQTCALLERCRLVFFSHGDKLARSGIRGAHIIHKLRVKPCRRRRAPAERLIEGLLHIGACDKRPVRSSTPRKTGGQQRNVGMVCGAAHLHARRISVDAIAIRHRDNRELQALRGVYRHDANCRGVTLI